MITRAMLALLAGTSAASAGVAFTDWNSGTLEGWTFDDSTDGGTWVNPGVGGNGGGYISYIDGPNPATTPPQIFAPAQFLGDYSALDGVGYFEYDIINESSNQTTGNYQRIRLLGDNGVEARALVEYVPTSSWQTIRVDIVESNWQMLTGTWSDLIDNITGLYFGGDVTTSQGIEGGVDNFRLVPAPGSAALLIGGLSLVTRRRR